MSDRLQAVRSLYTGTGQWEAVSRSIITRERQARECLEQKISATIRMVVMVAGSMIERVEMCGIAAGPRQ